MIVIEKTYNERIKDIKVGILIPTYNNSSTLSDVIDSVLDYTEDIIVVNDGSDDNTIEILEKYSKRIKIISYSKNKGKGYALKMGFKEARKLSYDYLISIDSDGQHFASDLPAFIKAIEDNPNALIIGSRSIKPENRDKSSTFANKLSNFWFFVQTLSYLPDTQSGYRAYPLNRIGKMQFWTKRYETELEILVFSAWRRLKIIPLKISVYYASPEKRISHFDPVKDFIRISILNTFLTLLALLYGYPSMGFRYLFSLFADDKK